jgi:hypothetical protein
MEALENANLPSAVVPASRRPAPRRHEYGNARFRTHAGGRHDPRKVEAPANADGACVCRSVKLRAL